MTMSSEQNDVVICRCCLAECKEYKSLHKEGIILGEVTTLASLLAFCTSLDFDGGKNDGALPTVVCNNCIQDIAKSYLFKKKVLESDEALRSQLLDDEIAAELDREEQSQSEDFEHDNAKEAVKNQTYHRREQTETDLEELAAAAQMKRELDQQMYEAQDEYDEPSLAVLENDEEEVQIEDEQEEEEQPIHDDDDLDYVVQEVAETTEIYHTTEIDHCQSPQQQQESVIEEEVEEMEHVEECEEEIEYEIHVNEIEEDYNEIITSDPVEVDVKRGIKRNLEDSRQERTTAPKGSRNRNRSANKIPNPNFQCKVCEKQLSNSSSFKYHMQLHSDDTPYKCDVCDESFKTRNAYDGHKRTHDPNNPNTCELCGKSYRQPSSLRTHMHSHTGEKPFVCNICGKSLTQKSGYKKHMLTHTGEKPYPCDVCGKAFRISSNMLAHRRSHAGDKPHSCVECEKSFGTFEQLKRHMLVHSEQKPFACNTCGKQFKRLSTMRAHAQSHCYTTAEVTNYDKKICKSNVVEII